MRINAQFEGFIMTKNARYSFMPTPFAELLLQRYFLITEYPMQLFDIKKAVFPAAIGILIVHEMKSIAAVLVYIKFQAVIRSVAV